MKPFRNKLSKIGWVVFSVVLGQGIFQCSEPSSESGRVPKEESFAPSFVLPDIMGEKVKFSEFQGKAILLNFWATWCAPCRREVPRLNELYEKHAKEGLVVIGISLDYGKPEVVRDFLQGKKIAFVILMGNKEIVGTYGRIPGFGSIRGIPTTYLIDRKGRVVQKFVGSTSEKRMEEALRPLLNEAMR